MGTWSTAIKGNDLVMDVYGAFFDLYNKGAEPETISKKIVEHNRAIGGD